MLLKKNPRKINFKKNFCKIFKLKKLSLSSLKYGNIGICALENHIISFEQIETLRRTIIKNSFKNIKFFIRGSMSLNLTAKPREARMGKGKGSTKFWGFPLKKGKIFLEILSYDPQLVVSSLEKAKKKFPINYRILYINDF